MIAVPAIVQCTLLIPGRSHAYVILPGKGQSPFPFGQTAAQAGWITTAVPAIVDKKRRTREDVFMAGSFRHVPGHHAGVRLGLGCIFPVDCCIFEKFPDFLLFFI
jgi:hypothetical protein